VYIEILDKKVGTINLHQLSYQLMSHYSLSNQYASLNDFDVTQVDSQDKTEPFIFQTQFQGYMEMFNPPEIVSQYLDQHHQWFPECAQPMRAETLGDNGYTLIIGRFGSFGYEVEPKMSVVFEVTQEKKYLMYSVETPESQGLGYTVEYQSSMELNGVPLEASSAVSDNYLKKVAKSLPSEVTQVTWNLDLNVGVWLPKFIHRLPSTVIQSTGDRLLTQIVRQVSPRLTLKVQKNFHDRLNIPVPPKTSRYFDKR